MKLGHCAFLLLTLSTQVIWAATDEVSHPFPGVTYHSETQQNPPMRVFVAEVDLANPHVHVRVAPGGPDPDGTGKWQTTLMRPTKVAEREHFDLVVNGDFFSAYKVKDAEGTKSKFVSNIWALVVGPAMTDGKTWSQSSNNRPCLVVHKDRSVDFEMLAHPQADDTEVISGNVMLVRNGAEATHAGKSRNGARNPRTMLGLDAKKTKLTIVVVDGRKPGISVGMSYAEEAAEMIRLGCKEALNLDGGGSSVMAIRDKASGQMKIENVPSDGRERAVANTLGITVD